MTLSGNPEDAMADRASWTGIVSVGLVTIPVKLYSATHSEDLSFRLIHAQCGTPVERRWWCPYDEEEVQWDDLVRGYEYERNKYVLLTDQDLETLPVRSRHRIEITAFVPEAEVDPVYFDRTYQLAPDTQGDNSYAVLLQAMEAEGVIGIATITMRKKQQVAAIRAHTGSLLLETMFHPDEVSLQHAADLAPGRIEAQDVKLARDLIHSLTESFDEQEFRDEYRSAALDLIDAKLEGREVETLPAPEPKVIDLREALARSLAARGGGRRVGGSMRG
jgi:DNA end-binding protein Ku